MRTARKISITVVALVLMTVGLALPAQAGTEGSFLSKINASRSAAGLPPMSMHSDLVPRARSHSAAMMNAGSVYHSSNLGSVTSGWEALAENVGVGPTVDSLHDAFMNSAGHRRNILGNYNHVGVGVSQSENGQLWVTMIFMRKNAPAPTTTTTTSPPVTTTTAAPPPPPAPTTTTAAPAPAPKPTTTTAAPAPKTKTTTAPAAPGTTTTAAPTTTTTAAPEPDPEPKAPPAVPLGRALYLPIVD